MKSIVLTALIASCVSVSFAQEEVVYVRMDKPKRQSAMRTVDWYNAVKFDPVRIFTGELNFSYERRIADKTSLEFELGPTVSNLSNSLDFGMHSGNSNESKFGVVTSAAIRYYPMDNMTAFNRFYVSPKFTFRNFNNEYTSYYTGETSKGYDNYAQFTFNFGIQTWISKTFAIDYYAGMGLGTVQSKGTYYSQVWDYQTQTYVSQETKFNDTYNRVVFVLGVKFGLGM